MSSERRQGTPDGHTTGAVGQARSPPPLDPGCPSTFAMSRPWYSRSCTAWTLKLSSTFVYGHTSTWTAATASRIVSCRSQHIVATAPRQNGVARPHRCTGPAFGCRRESLVCVGGSATTRLRERGGRPTDRPAHAARHGAHDAPARGRMRCRSSMRDCNATARARVARAGGRRRPGECAAVPRMA